MSTPAEVRKALVALVGAGGPLGAAIADPNTGTIAAAVVALLVVVGVHQFPNAKKG